MKEIIQTYKKPIIGGVLLMVLLLGYFTREKWMSWLNIGDSAKEYASNNSSSKPSSSSTTIDKTKVLSKGSKGASVKELQRLLNVEYDYQKTSGIVPIEPKLAVDSNFGPKTESMLSLFTGKTSISINALIQELKNQKAGA
jgi:hypothetical protein